MHTLDSGTQGTAVVEDTTAMAVVERRKLQKSLRRFDMLFFTLCALIVRCRPQRIRAARSAR
jgi:hypothetical protein